MIAWQTVENAIRAWVVAGSGLAEAQVYWSEENGPRPSGPSIALSIPNLRRRGRDWTVIADAAVPQEGQEIEHRSQGQREITIAMQAFDGDATGTAAPRARLEQVLSNANLPARQSALKAAGVAVFDFGPVLPIGGVIGGSRFEPRAVLEARAYLASEVVELGTFIESAEVTNELTSETFTVTT